MPDRRPSMKRPTESIAMLRAFTFVFLPDVLPVEDVEDWLKIQFPTISDEALSVIEDLHCRDKILAGWRVERMENRLRAELN